MVNNNQQVNEALSLTSQLIPLVEEVENELKGARTWGVLDIFGGGLLTDLFKHRKLNQASRNMEKVSFMMQNLQHVLGGIQIPQEYRMVVGDFATFGDFLFDGAIFDIYMFAKIMGSINTVRDLKNKLYILRTQLQKLLA